MKKVFLFSLLALLMVSCNEIDNYEAPSSTLTGVIVDSETGENIPSQAPNGLRVRLYDLQYDTPQPIDFWGTQEGTFTNNRLFPGDYKMIVDNGGFYPLDTITVSLPTDKKFTVKALPYLRIQADATTENNSIIVNYTLEETQPSESKIVESAILINSTPYVDANNFVNESPFTDLANTNDADVTDVTLADTLSGLESGKTYYLRVGATTDNVGTHYNYSKVIKVVMP